MKRIPASDPESSSQSASTIELALHSRCRDVGEITVRRVLPTLQRKLVGPFIFLDHFGPFELGGERGVNVRPHPHIGLATVTFLFDGEILHRDSLGYVQPIRPGDVNWMIAGRGITHSERTPDEVRARGGVVHGVQCWVALPKTREEDEPSFAHHPAQSLPRQALPGGRLCVVLGEAYGVRSPVALASPTFYVEAELDAGTELELPEGYEERAAYVVEGAVLSDGRRFDEGHLLIFAPGSAARVRSDVKSRVMLLGGAKLDGERHVYWNFVSSSLERIEEAKRDWKEGRFPKVPGDEVEFIPLPD